ncbi:MAG: DNA-directed RNA polymerase subunit omega [Candidatus Aminicenantes bacterium]|nr:DNA-directed RNA polymerase subunit omega [Candidatus Aminicenantes bacterium]
MKNFGEVDSKFRFVHVASKRAKMLLKGAKPKIKTKSKNPIRIAQAEVKEGVINFEIIKSRKEELPEPEERIFLGGAGVEEADESADAAAEGIVDEEEAEAELSVEFDEDASEEPGQDDK